MRSTAAAWSRESTATVPSSTYGSVYVIPTENEWYKAAYYDPNKAERACRATGTIPPSTMVLACPTGSTSTETPRLMPCFDDRYDQGHPNDVDNAGVLSAYGTMGQGGNVWEWNETTIGSLRGVRGGHWHYYSAHLAASGRASYPVRDTHHRVPRGMCSEPGGIALLMCGGITGLMWWRRGGAFP